MLKKNKRLLILESLVGEKPTGFDHVISFSTSPADSYPHHYLTQSECYLDEDSVFDRSLQYLNYDFNQKPYIYRDVSLFWCFKKKIINFITFAEGRHTLLNRVLDRFKGWDLYIERYPHNWDAPYLRTIIEFSPVLSANHFDYIEPFQKMQIPYKKEDLKKDFLLNLLPERVLWGKVSKCKTGFFSDIQKISSVIKAVGPGQPIFYTNVKSPRNWFQAIVQNFAYYQAEYGSNHSNKIVSQAAIYRQLLDGSNPFASCHVSDYVTSGCLWQMTKDLFSRELMKLLYDINAAHDFFSIAKSLCSMLLDEDAAPVKNAFCQVAQKYNVRTYVTCHSSLGKKNGYLPLTADRMFVWGAASKRKLEEWGCEDKKLIIAGCPRYDAYSHIDALKVKKQVATKWNFDPNKKIVVIAFMISAPNRRRLFDQRQRELLQDVMSLIPNNPDIQFIIKAKNQKDANYRHCLDWVNRHNLTNHAIVTCDYDPLLLVIAADLVIVHNTAFNVDAVAFERPTISYCDNECLFSEEYKPYEVFYAANSPEELRFKFEQILRKDLHIPRDRFKVAQTECFNRGEKSAAEIIARELLTRSSNIITNNK